MSSLSDVEKLWVALSAKFGSQRHWSSLSSHEQQVFIQGINMILSVVYSKGERHA
jgi:hypothetical protein